MSAQKRITEHLDLWTGAIASKSSSGRGSNSKIELAGIRKLRELILALAVRGKLVEQNTNDEPAALLLQRLATPKQRPISKASRKKANDTSHTEGEKLFCIPENWCWAALPEIAHYKPGRTPSTKDSKFWSKDMFGTPWVSIADMEHFGTIRDTSKRITEIAAKTVFRSDPVKPGSILMSFKLTVGKISINEVPVYHNEAIISIEPAEGIHRDYLFKVLPMLALGGNTKRAIMGNTLNATSLAQILVPVPPKEEQARIVRKVDELMTLCDRLEQQTSDQLEAHEALVDTLLGTLTQSENATDLTDNWARLATHFDTLFTTEQSIDKLKQAILQLAVMGRLVEQDARDAPASELLNMVQDAERRLRNSGKIRGKRSGRSEAHQSPTQKLPVGWEFASLSELGQFSGGKTPSKLKPQFWDGDIPWVTPKDMKVHRINGSEDKVTQLAVDDGLALYPENSIFFVVRSGILRRMFPTAISTVPCTVNQDLKVLTLYTPELSEYVQLMMLGFEQFILDHLTKTGTTVESLKFDEFSRCSFPIPPLAEQGRIKEKVQEILTLCDELKQGLRQAVGIRCKLADVIVEQAIS